MCLSNSAKTDCTICNYNDHVIRVNVLLQQQITLIDSVYFWKHRAGLWNPAANIYMPDGIHLSYDLGYTKYFRSLRDCIFRLIKWWVAAYLLCEHIRIIITRQGAFFGHCSHIFRLSVLICILIYMLMSFLKYLDIVQIYFHCKYHVYNHTLLSLVSVNIINISP